MFGLAAAGMRAGSVYYRVGRAVHQLTVDRRVSLGTTERGITTALSI